jgi:PPM family protein phosphatase
MSTAVARQFVSALQELTPTRPSWRRRPPFAGLSEPGSAHAESQDFVCCESLGGGLTLLVVADGLGGLDQGTLASRTAVFSVFRHLKRYLARIHDVEPESIPQLLHAAVGRANLDLRSLCLDRGCELGSTLCAALVDGGHRAVIASVGDSRCYLYNRGSMIQITRDHTLLRQMLALGTIEEQEAASHPLRGVLSRYLGKDDDLDVTLIEVPLDRGSKLLLCTDGVWGHVSWDQMMETMQNSDDPIETCHSLISAASLKWGFDDMSCALWKCC